MLVYVPQPAPHVVLGWTLPKSKRRAVVDITDNGGVDTQHNPR